MNEPTPPDRRFLPSSSAQAWIVFGLALAVRLAYFAEQSYKPYFGAPLLDARYLAEQAAHLLHHSALPPGPLFRPPLYTLFITPLTALLPNAPVAPVAFVQHMLGAFWALLMLWTGRRAGGAAAGFCAGLLAAFYAPSIFYEGEMLSDSATLWLTSAVVILWLVARSSGSRPMHALSGIVAGLATITRPTALLPALALAAASLIATMRNPAKRKSGLLATTLFLMPIALITALPTIYNAAQGDTNFIASQGGINFWLGNNPSANGVSVIVPPVSTSGSAAYQDSVDTFSRQALSETESTENPDLKPSQISHIWYAKSFDWLLQNPAQGFRLQVRKIVAIFNDHEVRNNRGFFFARRNESWVLRLLPITFGFVFTFAAIGLIALPSLPPFNRRASQWVILSGIATCAGIIAFFVAGRLRLPLAGAVIPIAGVGAAHLLHLMQSRNRNKLIAIAIIAFASAFFSYWIWPVLDYRLSPDQPSAMGLLATDHDGMDNALLAQGSLGNNRPKAAMGYAFEAARLSPKLPYAHALLGESAIAASEPRTAAMAYLNAADLEPQKASHYANAGVAFEALDQFSQAEELYRAALQLDPLHARATANLSELVSQTGNPSPTSALSTPAQSLAHARSLLQSLAE